MLCITKAASLKQSFHRYVLKEEIPAFLNHLRKSKLMRRRIGTELNLRTNYGKAFAAELISLPVEALHGAVTAFRTVIIDISERRAAEKALVQSRQDYQRLLDSIE